MTKAGIFRLGESGLDVSPLEQQREFSYQIKIYDRDDNKVAEIASGIKNVTLEQLNFGYLQDGGCADFSFTLGEEFTQATIGYNYRVEFCFYNQPNPWYSGFITKLPEKGTDKIQTYSGYGYAKQLSWIRIDEEDLAQEVADIVSDIIDYVEANTDIVKDSDKLDSPIYQMVSNIYWDKIPANDLFERLRQLAGDYEWGVDEERDFYFREISTQIFENFWIGKHLDSFKGTEDPDSIRNKLYVKCGRLTDGSDYVFYVEDTTSQGLYGLREEVIVAPEFWPTFPDRSDVTNLAFEEDTVRFPAAGASGDAVDGDVDTYWNSGEPQEEGDYIQVDLGEIYDRIARVILDSTTDEARDQFARGFDIRIAVDAGDLGDDAAVVFTSEELSTNNPDIRFTPKQGRYVRITLTVNNDEDWHLGEFEVYELNTSDVEEWADNILDQKKIIRKKATLTIKGVNKLIEKKHVIKPFKPYGKWGIYAEDGTHIEDYQVKSVKYVLSGNSFDMSAELGQLERESIPAEFKKQLQRLEEYNMSGIRKVDDLSGGTGAKPMGITRTTIGPDVIEVPMLKSNKISMYGGKVEAGEKVMQAGGHGFVVKDASGYFRFEAGKLNGDYGVSIRDANDKLMLTLGSFTFGDAKARAYANVSQVITNTTTTSRSKIRLDTKSYDPGNNFDISVWAAGTATATVANRLVDAGAAFTAAMRYSIVKNVTDTTYATIETVVDANNLILSKDIFVNGEDYNIVYSKFVAPIDGDYICVGAIRFFVDAPALLNEAYYSLLFVNDALYTLVANHTGSLPGISWVTTQVVDVIPLNIGDELTLWGDHSVDDADVGIQVLHTFLCVHLLSAI